MYMYAYAYYILRLYYIYTEDTSLIAVCFNVYDYICLACFDGYARPATLITDRLRIAFTLITDSC